MAVDRKNQKALALLYLASKPLRKAANSSSVPTEFEQNRQGKFELFDVTITSLPKFLGLIGYQISLAMELRAFCALN